MSDSKSTKKNRVLYVGDLHPTVDENTLHSLFCPFSPYITCEIRRDLNTGYSLGYGFITFPTVEEAKLALEKMNYMVVFGRPMRLMFKEVNRTLRDSGKGNLFVKNLAGTINERKLADTFRNFGQVLAVKISRYPDGKSKGYGFVQFENEVDAQKCIKNINGKLLEGRAICASVFKPKHYRPVNDGFNNCYVKNLSSEVDDNALKEMFAKFGEIISARVMRDTAGDPKGYGFVCFADPACAQTAVITMNGAEVNGQHLYVGQAQKKEDRAQFIRQQIEIKQNDKFKRSIKIAVANLDKNITDANLTAVFSKYDSFIEATVMKDKSGCSKGIGLVAFSSHKDVVKAMDLNGTMLGSTAVKIALVENPTERFQIRHRGCASSGFSSVPAPFTADTEPRMRVLSCLDYLEHINRALMSNYILQNLHHFAQSGSAQPPLPTEASNFQGPGCIPTQLQATAETTMHNKNPDQLSNP